MTQSSKQKADVSYTGPSTLYVRQHNIDEGVKRSSTACALEDTMQEAVPEAINIRVDLQSIRFSLPATDMRYVFFTPKNAQQFILAFDRGETVKPIKVVLGEPVKVMPIRHEYTGNLDVLATARRNYEKKRKNGHLPKRKRQRRFGVQMFVE